MESQANPQATAENAQVAQSNEANLLDQVAQFKESPNSSHAAQSNSSQPPRLKQITSSNQAPNSEQVTKSGLLLRFNLQHRAKLITTADARVAPVPKGYQDVVVRHIVRLEKTLNTQDERDIGGYTSLKIAWRQLTRMTVVLHKYLARYARGEFKTEQGEDDDEIESLVADLVDASFYIGGSKAYSSSLPAIANGTQIVPSEEQEFRAFVREAVAESTPNSEEWFIATYSDTVDAQHGAKAANPQVPDTNGEPDVADIIAAEFDAAEKEVIEIKTRRVEAGKGLVETKRDLVETDNTNIHEINPNRVKGKTSNVMKNRAGSIVPDVGTDDHIGAEVDFGYNYAVNTSDSEACHRKTYRKDRDFIADRPTKLPKCFVVLEKKRKVNLAWPHPYDTDESDAEKISAKDADQSDLQL